MLEALLLGILQGLTEFLPVSSSGHLVLAQALFQNMTEQGLVFDVMLHAGTLIAVVVYFRQDLKALLKNILGSTTNVVEAKETSLSGRFLLGLIIATVPAGLVGIFLEDRIESTFQSTRLTSIFLMTTGGILILSELVSGWYKHSGQKKQSFSLLKSLMIGIAQSFALLPGISRSGSTISMGLLVGWSRSESARFSFLLMIPAVFGAVVLKLPDVINAVSSQQISMTNILVGFFSAGLSGYIAVCFLIRFVRNNPLYLFGGYCFLLGSISLYLFH